MGKIKILKKILIVKIWISTSSKRSSRGSCSWGILLDPDAIGRIADLIKPEAFYINAHQEIYRTALMLHTQVNQLI